MTTFDMLLAHFGGIPMIPLEAAAPYWGYEPDTLAKKVEAGDVRLPFFRLDTSQKAARLVMLSDVAELLDERHRAASENFLSKWEQE